MKLKIVENFLENEDINELKSLKLKKIKDNEIKVYHNRIYKNGTIQSECLSNQLIERLNSYYHPRAINILNDLNRSKADLYDYSEFHIIETGINCKFPIHDDTPNKILSGVIYLNPEKNNGTIFYKNKKGDGKQIIDWKVNKGVFFSRNERESWHSYEGDGKSNRLVLVYNLMTNNIRDVYRIEKKNYFIGQLRYKLNPFLYKFFNLTI